LGTRWQHLLAAYAAVCAQLDEQRAQIASLSAELDLARRELARHERAVGKTRRS
jgi:hypothetical protein